MGDVKVDKFEMISKADVVSQVTNPDLMDTYREPGDLGNRKPYVRPTLHLLEELRNRTHGTKTSAVSELTTCGS